MDLGQFSIEIGRFANRVPMAQSAFTRELVLSVAREEGKATPVDTGEARSNWLVGVNRDRTDHIPPHAPGYDLGRAETGNQGQMVEAARLELSAVTPESTINLSNNVDYMYYLNEQNPPSSAQNTTGFVEVALELGLQLGIPLGMAKANRILGG